MEEKLEVRIKDFEFAMRPYERKFIVTNEGSHLGVYSVNESGLLHRNIAEKFNIPDEKVLGGAKYRGPGYLEIFEGSVDYGEIPRDLAENIAEKIAEKYIEIGKRTVEIDIYTWPLDDEDKGKWKNVGY